jgi:hypothetical protein
MKKTIMLERVDDDWEPMTEGLLRKTFRRLRLPVRTASSIEQTAARNRVERLFAVNFRSPWTR